MPYLIIAIHSIVAMGNSEGSKLDHGSNAWGTFDCFTDDGESSMITDSSISEINSEDIIQHVIWEFQRYHPAIGWGAGGNLLPKDPGRWANHRRDIFGDTLQGVAPAIPEGYRVDLGWAIVVQRRKYKANIAPQENAKASITDCFGWHYSNSFEARSWSDEHKPGMNVRRRAWRRTLIPCEEEK